MSRNLSFRTVALAAVVALALACPGDDEEKKETPAGLEGEWRVSILRAGTGVADGTTAGWVRARFSLDASGLGTVHESLDAFGSSALPTTPIQYALGASGEVALTDGPWTDYLGQLDPDGRFWAATATAGGATQFRLSERVVPGTTFAQADLAGSWHFHSFLTGGNLLWQHGRATITAAGDITLSTRVSSEGPLDDVNPPRLVLDANGLVSMEGGASPTWVGVLSADKDLMIVTSTAPSSGHVYELLVVTRNRSDAVTADLAGRWKVFMLDQDAAGGGWSRLTATFGADGTGSLSDYADSHGGTTVPGDVALTVAADRTMAEVGNDRWHGALAEGDDIWVAVTDRDDGAQASLFVAVRRP